MLAVRLGLPRLQGATGFLVALLVDALGTGFFTPISLLYFHAVAGLPLPAIGIALTLATVLTLPLTPLTGALVDRLGARRLVIASHLLQAAGFLGYLLVGTIPALLGSALLVTAGVRVFYAAAAALIAEIAAPGEQDRWFGLVGATQSIGLGAGALLAGLVVGARGVQGYRVLILANALSFVLAATLVRWSMAAPRPRGATTPAPHQGYRTVLADRPFLGVIACNVVFALCAQVLSLALPVYATEALGAPLWVVGAAFALNTGLIVGAQTVVVRLLESFRRTQTLLVAGLVWAAANGLFALALAVPQAVLVPYLLAVVALYTGGVLLYAPTLTALAAASAPERLRGRYLAAYEFSWGVSAALAPGLFTALYALGPALPWLVLSGLVLVAAVLVAWLEPRLPAQAVRLSGASRAEHGPARPEHS